MNTTANRLRLLEKAIGANRIIPLNGEEPATYYTVSFASLATGARWYQGVGRWDQDCRLVLVGNGSEWASIERNENPDTYNWDRYRAYAPGTKSREFATRREAIAWVEAKILEKYPGFLSATP